MCGVVGFLGQKNIYSNLKNSLQLLEYRGYDSCGMLLIGEDQETLRVIGSSKNFTDNSPVRNITLGIGHNRWATHGPVSLNNTHPIENELGYVVHNGVVENVEDFELDVKYKGNTDTERILHFFTHLLERMSVEDAMKIIWEKMHGTSVFLFVLKNEPNKIYFLRKGISSLYLGLGDDGQCLCSDANVVFEYCDKVLLVQDDQYGYIDAAGVEFFSENNHQEKMNAGESNKNYRMTASTWLRTEIDQQPEVLKRTLYNLKANDKQLKDVEHVCFAGCGSAYYAGCIASDWCNALGVPSRAILASEFGSKSKLLETSMYKNSLFVFISQSGQTLETIEAASIVHKHGLRSLGIINTHNSVLSSYVDDVWYTSAGVEKSVASTKAFSAQLVALGYLVSKLLKVDLLGSLEKARGMLKNVKAGQELVSMCNKQEVLYILSKGLGVDVGREIALKIKELSYLHAFAMSSSEFKHGPLALVDEKFLAVVLNPSFGAYERINANTREIISRGGKVIMLTDKPWEKVQENLVFWQMPETDCVSFPLVYVKAGQELALALAQARGCNIDQPRNLVKSVTVI